MSWRVLTAGSAVGSHMMGSRVNNTTAGKHAGIDDSASVHVGVSGAVVGAKNIAKGAIAGLT